MLTIGTAFLWEKGEMIDLGTLPGAFFSAASGINDKGEIVGRSAFRSGYQNATLWIIK